MKISFLVRNITYPAWMVLQGDGGSLKYLNGFGKADRMTPEELERENLQRLKGMLVHAYENTVYYKNLFDERGFSPYSFNEPSRIEVLPLLTKEIIRNNQAALTTANIPEGDRFTASTGGSTGVPLVFLRDRKCRWLRWGQEHYFNMWMKHDIGEKVALFVENIHSYNPDSWRWARIRNATCERLLPFNPHHITRDYMREFAGKYLRYRAPMIRCFPNSLAIFADFLEKEGIHSYPVRTISCTGETLYGWQKRFFERAFGAEIFEKYASTECGTMASECRMHDGMHIFTQGIHMEIIKPDGEIAGPGEMGKIVITDLFNRAMPLVRYEIGDMAVAGDGKICRCGSPLPLVKKILGRDREIVLDMKGDPKPGYLFAEAVKSLNLPGQFQIEQTERGRLLVRIVNLGKSTDTGAIRSKCLEIMGEGAKIDFEYPEEIKRNPSGKYSYVISRVSPFRDKS